MPKVAAVAVASTLLLSARTELRALTSKLSREDVLATLKFMVVAVVVLPLLPNEDLGPWGALNPFRVGVMVTMIAGVNFVGYAAMRWLGARDHDAAGRYRDDSAGHVGHFSGNRWPRRAAPAQ